ncbi:hypothetical protein [Oceanobacillus neutriphilus]|uniref:hypothetical protein n=1 Tax=Oceanobacillus neutriphilus TaxID=531815 RepID=UPI001E373B32|nr:hypothetical protein [Oceanobacillus neutriphilus]
MIVSGNEGDGSSKAPLLPLVNDSTSNMNAADITKPDFEIFSYAIDPRLNRIDF